MPANLLWSFQGWNSCLSFVHCHMSSRDKTMIREATCGKFSLEQLKTAREVIYTTCEPDKHYGYNGPHAKNNSEKERMYDAFEGIFSKLVKLDAAGQMPSLSVPSDELMNLLVFNGGEHTTCERKFENMNRELDELKKTFHSFVAVTTSTNSYPAIPPVTRSRLMSTGSVKRKNGDDFNSSEAEDEDEQSQEETEGDKGAEYRNQRKQRSRSVKRAKIQNDKPQEVKKDTLWSDKVKMKARPKPPSTWGSAKPNSSFRGAVSDIFLYNCDADVTAKDVVDHFQANQVTIKNIERRSHDLATRTSFRLSPATKDDHDKIIQGDLLPEQVAVRRYVPRRWDPTTQNPNNGRNQFKPVITAGGLERQLDQISTLREINEMAITDNSSTEIIPERD